MDSTLNEIRNSIMEEVILKNYKLLQFVENEINQLKNEIKLLKDDNDKLKDDNDKLKDDNNKLKEENTCLKENKNLFSCDIQNIQDTNENTMIIGYTNGFKHFSWNVDKAHLIPSFNECTELLTYLYNIRDYSIIMSTNVFKHINKYNNFKTFTIDYYGHNKLKMLNIVDENLKKICLLEDHTEIIKKTEQTDWISNGRNMMYHKPNLKIFINILNECNINVNFEDDYTFRQIMDLPPKIKNRLKR
jgi:hypothetical protein